MRLIVLGSAAGGGIPQWNCACPNCERARRGDGVKPRSQDSIAVSADGQRWFLLNVSPDVSRQIERTPALWPRPLAAGAAPGVGSRGTPIAGAVLTNGDVDHCLGLLSLREWTPLSLYATRETYLGLVRENAIFRTLERQRPHLVHRGLELDSGSPSASARPASFSPLCDAAGETVGLSVAAFPVAGKVPLHLEASVEPSAETNVGLIVRDDRSGARLVYVPGAASVDGIAERSAGAACLFFDGTFWSDRELAAFGQSRRTAREMAHLPVGDAGGSLEGLDGSRVPRRFYTHVNNTNPMLREGSEERRRVEACGWAIAEDGLELSL